MAGTHVTKRSAAKRASGRNRRLFKKQYHDPGTAPGTLRSRDAQGPGHPTVIDVVQYTADRFSERKNVSLDEALDAVNTGSVTWIHVTGLGDSALLERLGRRLGIHPLALEDVLNVPQRPKVEEYEQHQFVVVQMASWADDTVPAGPEFEQLSLFFNRSFVVTIQTLPGDPFAKVRERLRKDGPIREHGTDYLAYALVDAVVDAYFPVLERLGDRLEALEDELLLTVSATAIEQIHDLKRNLLALRRVVWPLREVINTLVRAENPIVADATRVYLRDCYDHTVFILDLVETYREFAADLIDLYMSRTGQRLNEIMKVLTIISTIFIPLTSSPASTG